MTGNPFFVNVFIHMKNFNQKAVIFFATGGLIGFSPVAPGTFGSLAALPLCLLISSMRFWTASILTGVLFLLATWIAYVAEKIIGEADPGQIVVDEVLGMAVTLFGLSFTPVYVIGGFALFRVFDILKPFPIRWIDKKISGGLGIMLDDIVAGIFANAILRLAAFYFV